MVSQRRGNSTESPGGQSSCIFTLSKMVQPLRNRKFEWHGGLKMAPSSYRSSCREVDSVFPPLQSGLVTCSDLMSGTKWSCATYKHCLQRPWHREIETLNVWQMACGTDQPPANMQTGHRPAVTHLTLSGVVAPSSSWALPTSSEPWMAGIQNLVVLPSYHVFWLLPSNRLQIKVAWEFLWENGNSKKNKLNSEYNVFIKKLHWFV